MSSAYGSKYQHADPAVLGELRVGFNQILGEGLSVNFYQHSLYTGITDARFTFHHSSLDLAPTTIELLITFVRSNSRSLGALASIRVQHQHNTADFENGCVRLRTICNILHCIAFSGCRIQHFDLDLRITPTVVPLQADHGDCRFFGLIIRSFFEDVNSFRFHACIGESSSLQKHSLDHIVEALCSVWDAKRRRPREFQHHDTLDIHSTNFFEHVSVPVVNDLCCMPNAPGLAAIHVRRLNEPSLYTLSQAVRLSDQAFRRKKLKLSFVGNLKSVHVHNLVKHNKVFRAIRISPCSFGDTFHVRSCILPLWKTAMESRTDDVEYDISSAQFTEEDLQEARDMLHTGFQTNKTLRRFLGTSHYHRRNQELGDVISMYTSINNAKRRKLNPGVTAHPPLASTATECINVLANLAGTEQEDSARYYVLRSNPHIVQTSGK